MELIDLIDKIEMDCYADRYRDALSEVQEFIDEIQNNQEIFEQMLPVLRTIVTAMEIGDNVLIGDCLEYGIKSVLEGHSIVESCFEMDLNSIPDVGEDIFYYASFSEEPVLCKKNADGRIVRLNSLFSPIEEIEKWIISLNLKTRTPVVCLFGLGTGLFAEAILKKLPYDGVLIIYEPEKTILDYCLNSGRSPESDDAERRIKERIEKIQNDKRVRLVIESEDRISFRYILEANISYLNISEMVVAKHNNYDRVYRESCLNFIHEINDHRMKMFTNKNTIAHFKERLVGNLLNNIKYYNKINTYTELSQILPKDIPAIIVAAGPSLDKNIDLLKEAKGHCFIFAVDTAIRYLLPKGIIPDLTITIDAEKPANYFSGDLSHAIPCVFDVTANPEILNNHKGRIILYNNSNNYMRSLFNATGKCLNTLSGGGSVATSAFAILHCLGQKKIILIGQDLAFENGVSHAGGIDDNADYTRYEVEGVNGETVITRSDWLGYLKWYEKSVDAIKEDKEDIQVIDATEGGAKIQGTDIMTLKEALDSCRDSEGKLPDYDFGEKLTYLDYYFNEDEYKNLIANYYADIDKLKEIERDANEAVGICNQLLKGIKNGTVSASYIDKEKKKISKINEKCSRTRIFPMLNAYLITDVADEVSRLRFSEGDIRTVEENGIKLLKISFEAISEAAKKIYMKAKNL